MKKEYGRSMIEMLGVLAIIGVLSIGGLAGYTMAMNRHRANTVLDYVARCAVVAQTRGTGVEAWEVTTCGALLPDEVAAPAGNYEVAAVDAADTEFVINVTNLANEAVAAAVVARNSANPKIAANGTKGANFTFQR